MFALTVSFLTALLFSQSLCDSSNTVYKSNQLNILRKPGDCATHRDYPNTIQCADTKQCISFEQFQNGQFDCCGPKNGANCADHSDEDRVAPTTECSSIKGHDKGASFQCAKTKVCLSRFDHMLNGRCDCCPTTAPDGDCSKCDDHSDEECYFSEWKDKFYCDGLCINKDLFADGKQDCPSTCVEPDVKERCQSKSRTIVEEHDKWWCQTLNQKHTVHRNCTDNSKCLTMEYYCDGVKDCSNGEDEDPSKCRSCTASEAQSKCVDDYTSCVFYDQNTFNCRCNSRLNCNKS